MSIDCDSSRPERWIYATRLHIPGLQRRDHIRIKWGSAKNCPLLVSQPGAQGDLSQRLYEWSAAHSSFSSIPLVVPTCGQMFGRSFPGSAIDEISSSDKT